jgi:Pyruvate/2-oxoacid:ferredoxin oxidoreductase delta subunit
LDVGSSRANHTGAWRAERPVYVHNLPPCNSACPAGENIHQWLYDAEEGSAKRMPKYRLPRDILGAEITFLCSTGSPAAGKHAPASFGALNTWYYADAPATVRPRLETARRITTFDEVTGGLDESTALFEARRCMSCGNCFGCDNCYGVRPDNAVTKLGTGEYQYEIDYDYCKGCGLCVAECPPGAIEMEPEPS